MRIFDELRSQWMLWGLVGCLGASITACGRPAERDAGTQDEAGRHSQHPALVGPLGGKLEEVLGGRYAGHCDRAESSMRKEVIAALDERYEQIQAAAKASPPSARFRRVTLGPTFVRELVNPPNPVTGWIDQSDSWSNIHAEYLRIKDTPVDKDWIWLDTNARSTLIDDEDRAVDGANMALDKDSGPRLEALLLEVLRCKREETCLTPVLDPALQTFVLGNPYYAELWSKIQGQENIRALRLPAIERFTREIQSDIPRYRFRSNSTVVRTSEKVLTLPLVAGPFAGAEAAFAAYVETLWNSASLNLKVKWVEPTDVPDAFKILLGDLIGGRAYVSSYSRVIQLYPDVRTRTIAHEVGHVLGFRDHYYTTWNESQCKYVYQSNAQDLMSSVDTGSVTAEEWADLERHYPQPVATI